MQIFQPLSVASVALTLAFSLSSHVAHAGVDSFQWGNMLFIQTDEEHAINLVTIEQYRSIIIVDYWSGENLLVSSTYHGYSKYRSDRIDEIYFIGGDKDDLLRNESILPITAYGNGGTDILVGGRAGDYLDGGPGTDELIGLRGNDTLVGGPDSDGLSGGEDNDTLIPEGRIKERLIAPPSSPFAPQSQQSEELYAVGGEGRDTFVMDSMPTFLGESILLEAYGIPDGFPFDFDPSEDRIQ